MPRGFVEPNPEFFRRLELLTQLSIEGLRRFGYLNHGQSPGDDLYIDAYSSLQSKYDSILELISFLKTVSQKQLDGTPLSENEFDQIAVIGGVVERLTLSLYEPYPGYWDLIDETDRFMAVVADVHTQGDNVLEEAVGYPNEILAVIPMGGALYLARGAVFSYYEFVMPLSNRLTDEAWQKMLKEDKAPDPPAWIRDIFNGVFRKAPDGKVFYSSGC